MNQDAIQFAVLGRDRRQQYLATLLTQKGYKAAYFEKPELSSSWMGEICLLPIPLSFQSDIDFAKMKQCHTLFAGCISPSFLQKAQEMGIVCHDYMQDEKFVYQNTIATAEGALAEAIMRFPGNLTRSRCLVIGYGHCGQTLVSMLERLGCHVTVCDSNAHARNQACVHAMQCIAPEALEVVLPRISCIFNTAPTLVLTEDLLKKTAPDALILDLASAPGGVDFVAAAALQRQAIALPGLPGKYAPLSSAEIMMDYILRTLSFV
ncbi:MAG: dipicolinate synthase [Lachnospiraceae bacterium]|nr:dipicolinate synthase [Lachnospiraceae bacterium]